LPYLALELMEGETLAYLSQFEGFTTAKCFSFSGG